jgi:hypothetical protein
MISCFSLMMTYHPQQPVISCTGNFSDTWILYWMYWGAQWSQHLDLEQTLWL